MVISSGLTDCPVSPPPLSSQNIQSHDKSPTSHRARCETKVMAYALGTNRGGKKRVKSKASRRKSSRIGSALVRVRRNVQHLEPKLPDSTRFVLITVLIVAVSASGPICCLVSPLPLSSQNVSSHMKVPASHRVRGNTQTMGLALGENCESKERIKGKPSRVQSRRIESALVCVGQNVQHHELKLLKSTRFFLIAVVMVDVFTSSEPTGCLVSSPPLSSQNVQSHEKTPASYRA